MLLYRGFFEDSSGFFVMTGEPSEVSDVRQLHPKLWMTTPVLDVVDVELVVTTARPGTRRAYATIRLVEIGFRHRVAPTFIFQRSLAFLANWLRFPRIRDRLRFLTCVETSCAAILGRGVLDDGLRAIFAPTRHRLVHSASPRLVVARSLPEYFPSTIHPTHVHRLSDA